MPTTPVILGRSTADLITNSDLINDVVEQLIFGVSGSASGTVAATLPALTTSSAGTSTPLPVDGTVAATLPPLTATMDGTSTAPGVTGDVNASLPALTANVAADVTGIDVDAVVAATLPSLGSNVAGTYTDPAVFVVEKHPRAFGTLPTSSSVTFAATPAVGDVIIVALQTSNPTSVTVGASGMGASFAVAHSSTAAGGGQDVFLIGSGATTAGAVTVTLSTAREGQYVVYLVRGLVTPSVSVHAIYDPAVDFDGPDDFDGPYDEVRLGLFVVAGIVTSADLSDALVTWPVNGGYVVDPDLTAAATASGALGYHAPTTDGSYGSTAALSGLTTESIRITQALFISPESGTVAATLPALSVDITGNSIPTTDGEVAATLPALSVAVVGDSGEPTIDGAVQATLPSLSASVEATFTPIVVVEGAPWTLDDSQLDVATIVDVEPVLAIVTTPPAAIPANLTPRLITRQSHQMDPAALDADPITGERRAPGTHTVVTEDVGYLHVWVDSVDVTYFGDAITRIGPLTSSKPGGDGTATLTFPTLTSHDAAGVGVWAWLRAGANVDIAIVDPDGVRLAPDLFNGSLISDEPNMTTTSDRQTWAAVGVFAGQPTRARHRAPIIMPATDIGTAIPRALNAIVGRRFGTIANATTNIPTTAKGTYAQSAWAYSSGLLSRAWTEDARQWTIKRTATPRQYVLALGDVTTVHWTVTEGVYGVEVDIDQDWAETYNVVYGHGIARDGYYWGNWKHPALSLEPPPPYPFTNPATDIDVGTTDADTDTGDGVTVWQERMKSLGYAVTVDGVYSSADETQARKIQRDRGLTVGGGVGPQTWNATFDEGTTGADLSKSYRAPLAWLPEVEPFLYAANGAIVGDNPAYDPSIERRESEDIDLGTGITKAEGIEEAQRMLARNSDPGWLGTITLRTDPWEGSRWFMFEDQNVLLLGHRGEDILLHIVGRNLDPETGELTLTVDSKARDALTVREIRERNAESRIDPTRRPGNANRRSRLDQDILNPFDGESGAGHFFRRPINGLAGLWSVVPVYISEAGQIVRVTAKSSGPVSRFWFALFGKEQTPNWMAANVGDPSQPNAWEAIIEDRENNGLIEQWGNDTQACGETKAGVVTGKFEDTGGLSYYSTKGGWTWAAVYAENSTNVELRFYPAPLQ